MIEVVADPNDSLLDLIGKLRNTELRVPLGELLHDEPTVSPGLALTVLPQELQGPGRALPMRASRSAYQALNIATTSAANAIKMLAKAMPSNHPASGPKP